MYAYIVLHMRQLDLYFKALADTNRLRIMNLLLHGELCVCDIQCVLESPQPNVSRHLAYLKNSGLVLDRRDGLRIFYRLNDDDAPVLSALYGFLRQAFRGERSLQQDVRNLREAIQAGHCTMTAWRPYSAISQRPAREA